MNAQGLVKGVIIEELDPSSDEEFTTPHSLHGAGEFHDPLPEDEVGCPEEEVSVSTARKDKAHHADNTGVTSTSSPTQKTKTSDASTAVPLQSISADTSGDRSKDTVNASDAKLKSPEPKIASNTTDVTQQSTDIEDKTVDEKIQQGEQNLHHSQEQQNAADIEAKQTKIELGQQTVDNGIAGAKQKEDGPQASASTSFATAQKIPTTTQEKPKKNFVRSQNQPAPADSLLPNSEEQNLASTVESNSLPASPTGLHTSEESVRIEKHPESVRTENLPPPPVRASSSKRQDPSSIDPTPAKVQEDDSDEDDIHEDDILTPEEEEAFEKAEGLKKDGNNFYVVQQYTEAVEAYKAALEIIPEKSQEQIATYHANLAQAYIMQENWQMAAKSATHCLKMRPGRAIKIKALKRRAQSYESLKDISRAYADFQELAQLDPEVKSHQRDIERLKKPVEEEQERTKEEMLSKLKELGNTVLGKFGMSLDNFKAEKDPNTGQYSISMQQ